MVDGCAVLHSPFRPCFMPERPHLDLLSSVLHHLHLRVGLFKEGAYRGPWSLDVGVLGKPTFHLIGRGQAWVHHRDLAQPIAVRGGDLVMFPYGDWHQITGTPERQPGLHLPTEGHGPSSTVLCALVEFDAALSNPVMRALPPVLVVHSEDAQASAQLNALARVMLAEYESGAAGQQGVLDRLAEVMFVLILRHHAQHGQQVGGLLGALRDPKLGRALSAFHDAPSQRWTVGSLAEVAGMSRTSFAERFNAVVGETPLHYLTGWRMQLADAALREGRKNVAQIAGEVGYETEAAFRRAFKRLRGVGPGSVRRAAAA